MNQFCNTKNKKKMKKLFLFAMLAFTGKAAMAQTGEELAFTKVGKEITLSTISSGYNNCKCYVLDTMFKLWNTGTDVKPAFVAGYSTDGATPAKKLITSTDGWTIAKNVVTLTKSCYYLPGVVHFDSGIILNIPAGTKFYGSNLTASAMVVLPRATINVKGTAAAPVVMTSAVTAASRNRGDWGGLVIAGRAPIAGSADGTFGKWDGKLTRMEGLKDLATATKKGGNIYLVGGTNEADNSGAISYLQVNYGGFNVGAAGSGNELNGITLYGVGNKTVIKNIQVTEANDDGIEFFGGSVNVSNVLIINSLDDDLDIDCGYQGTIQNVVVMRLDSNSRDVSGSKLIEASNKNPDHRRRTTATISNMTAFGPRSFAGKTYVFGKKIQYFEPRTRTWRDTTPSGNAAVDFFRGVEMNTNANISVYNSIIHGYDQAVNIADVATANNIDSGLVFAYNSINNCTEAISTVSKKTAASFTAGTAFYSSNAFPRNSATNWLKYDQQFNNILSSDAIKAQGYDITFTQNNVPALASIAFYTKFGTDYPATNKALQTLGTSWSPVVTNKSYPINSNYANKLDSLVVLKYAARIDNRGVKNFMALGYEVDPTTDYCSGQFVRPLDSDNGTTMGAVKSEIYVENPTSFGVINIGFNKVSADNMTVNVYDLSGKKVASKSMNLDNTSGNVAMDATNLTNGVYVVETNCGGVTSSSKVILNK
jgi:hypothetical protein